MAERLNVPVLKADSLRLFESWWGGRVVEGSSLENYRRLTPSVGSNPTPTAKLKGSSPITSAIAPIETNFPLAAIPNWQGWKVLRDVGPGVRTAQWLSRRR